LPHEAQDAPAEWARFVLIEDEFVLHTPFPVMIQQVENLPC
jgi:hypothetical protein